MTWLVRRNFSFRRNSWRQTENGSGKSRLRSSRFAVLIASARAEDPVPATYKAQCALCHGKGGSPSQQIAQDFRFELFGRAERKRCGADRRLHERKKTDPLFPEAPP